MVDWGKRERVYLAMFGIRLVSYMIVTELPKDPDRKVAEFGEEVNWQFEKTMFLEEVKGISTTSAICLVRKKKINRNPDETVQEWNAQKLWEDFGYRAERAYRNQFFTNTIHYPMQP